MRIASVLVALGLCACAGPNPTPDTQSTTETRDLELRGAKLGGPCQAARDVETRGATFEKHHLVRDVDVYAYSAGRQRISLIYCENDVLCEQSVTVRFATAAEANAHCGEQRTELMPRLGTPSLDVQAHPETLPPAAREIFDSKLLNPTIWELTESEVTLDCPTSPNGEGEWSVTLTHGFNPRVVERSQSDGSTLVVPHHACAPAR